MVYIIVNYKKIVDIRRKKEIYLNLCSSIKNFGAKNYNFGLDKNIYCEQVSLIERGIL